VKFLLILLFPISVLATGHIPATPSTGLDKEYNLRVFKKWAQVNWMADFQMADRENEDDFKAYTFGGKYRIHKNLKFGLAYSKQYGNRHDDDWLWAPGTWFWQKTDKRGENFLIADLIPRALFSFLPGERWVGELRVRYTYNFFNDQNTIKLRPRLTYFWFRKGKAFMNLFLQYEMYFPMDYGEETIYEKWLYLGGLYHFNKWFKPGIYLAKKSLTWSSSEAAKKRKPNEPYTVNHKSNIIGFNLIFNLPE
tara:strand:+ start:264726 stop:265478 length:753 start_codon:yes stop_codon:yes gene_type:complete